MECVQAKNMIVDLAHSSSRTIDDVLKITIKPVIISHDEVKGTYESRRNLSDKHIIGIAKVQKSEELTGNLGK